VSGVTVKCLEAEAWIDRPSPAGARETLLGLTTRKGRLTALIARGRGVRVVSLGADGRWAKLGATLPGSVASFGSGHALTVGIEEFRGARAVRTMRRFVSGRWRQLARLSGRGMGSQTSGPVVERNRVLLGVNEARARWTFSVFAHAAHRWRRLGGRALNRGRGKAQGVVSLAGSRPYAIWQENRPVSGGIYQTAVYTARLTRQAPGRPHRLWTGRSIGPSDLAVVRAQGVDWALYMPGRSASDPRLAVAVEPLTTRETR
jgi:hypothetical protein